MTCSLRSFFNIFSNSANYTAANEVLIQISIEEEKGADGGGGREFY
jgi:hypothetical protein